MRCDTHGGRAWRQCHLTAKSIRSGVFRGGFVGDGHDAVFEIDDDGAKVPDVANKFVVLVKVFDSEGMVVVVGRGERLDGKGGEGEREYEGGVANVTGDSC